MPRVAYSELHSPKKPITPCFAAKSRRKDHPRKVHPIAIGLDPMLAFTAAFPIGTVALSGGFRPDSSRLYVWHILGELAMRFGRALTFVG
jgi:hypothetical protein